ncbi:hypothetical protein, partial [Photorhabdus antumapuensis]|uniref:hypothetical protein n=1 Tax=Photorhabdus antumapuensis TaxID=2862867 RepID=UPI001CEE03D9
QAGGFCVYAPDTDIARSSSSHIYPVKGLVLPNHSCVFHAQSLLLRLTGEVKGSYIQGVGR